MNINALLTKAIQQLIFDRAQKTSETYRYGFQSFERFLLSQGISSDSDATVLTPDLFIQFPAYLTNLGYSRQTIGVYLASVKYLMDYLVINNMIELTYRDNVRLDMAYKSIRKKREARLPRFPRQETVELLLKAAFESNEQSPRRERNLAFIFFLATSGCRIAEACGMKISDIDMRDRSVIVTGKGSKERRVYFSEQAAHFLKAYWEARNSSKPNDPVFARHDKGAGIGLKKITTATGRNIVHDLCVQAGINPKQFTPHYFRHAFAIKMLSKTQNLALVQDLLGHANPTATRVYAKIYPEELAAAHREAFDSPQEKKMNDSSE